MPILEREASVYPENLLDATFQNEDLTPQDEAHDEAGKRCWWAVYTKARQEKAFARQLFAYNIPFYLPLVARDTVIRGRNVRSHIPVFAGYVFLYGDEFERVQSLKTNRTSRILPVADQRQLTHDLRRVHQLIESDAPLTVERRLTAGRHVRIKSGAMAGVEGTVISRRGRDRLLISVDFLQQGVSVEIKDYWLEPAD